MSILYGCGVRAPIFVVVTIGAGEAAGKPGHVTGKQWSIWCWSFGSRRWLRWSVGFLGFRCSLLTSLRCVGGPKTCRVFCMPCVGASVSRSIFPSRRLPRIGSLFAYLLSSFLPTLPSSVSFGFVRRFLFFRRFRFPSLRFDILFALPFAAALVTCDWSCLQQLLVLIFFVY